MKRRSSVTAALAFALMISGSIASAETPSRGARASDTQSDFNGDGFADIAAGIPGRDIGSTVNAGAVAILLGSANGITVAGAQLWSRASAGIAGDPFPNAEWGWDVVPGDYNGDGFDDIFVPETFFTQEANVIYGSASGLTSTGDQLIAGEVTKTYGIASGDFDGDGFDDIAWGDGSGSSVGVQVRYGTPVGLTDAGSQTWSEDSPGICDTAEGSPNFGKSLVSGDFNGDGRDDLAVGEFSETVGAAAQAGDVQIIYGSPGAGLASAGNQCWDEGSPGILGTPEFQDFFSWGLGAEDFNGDGRDDLASFGWDTGTGGVHILYGSASGLTATGNQLWLWPSGSGYWGTTIATGDFDDNGFDDMAASEFQLDANAGTVRVLYGTAGGLSLTGEQYWTQDSPGIADQEESNDRFGMALGGGNYGKGPEDDLAVSAPWEDLGAFTDTGAIHVIYGSPFELTATGSQFFSEPMSLRQSFDQVGYAINGPQWHVH